MRQKKARAVRAVEILCASAGVAAAYAHAAAQVPVPLQPFAQQVRQIETALKYLGQPLSPAEQSQINAAIANPDEAAAVAGDKIEVVRPRLNVTGIIREIENRHTAQIQHGIPGVN